MWDEYDIIVNCTGLSAGQLTGDPSIVPSRGQVMRVDNSSGKHTFAYIDNGTERMPYYIWTYVIVYLYIYYRHSLFLVSVAESLICIENIIFISLFYIDLFNLVFIGYS